MKRIIILMLVVMSGSVMGQSLSVFDIDTTNYPTIKAKYFALDSNCNQIKNLTSTDFEVRENGAMRTVNSVSCSTENPLKTVSITMGIDASWSMFYSDYGEIPKDLSKAAATELCKSVAVPRSEFALQTCDSKAFIIQDFTTDKDKIQNAISSLNSIGEDDFVENLLNQSTGLLNIAKSGKYAKVVVLFTDAWWYALTPLELQQCKDTCAKYNIQFYAVILSRTKAEPYGIQKSLQELADATGGYLYDGIMSDSAAKNIAKTIAQTAQGVEPCEITWQSGVSCKSILMNTNIKLLSQNINANINYQIANAAVAKLEFNPPTIRFKNPKIGEIVTQQVQVTAINSNFNIANITTTNPAFDINPKNFSLNANQTANITISYIASDSSNVFSQLTIQNDICEQKYWASAGWKRKKPTVSTLKIIQPNGNEIYTVGSDTSITWEGISPSDSVRIDYSIDSAKTWTNIVGKATSLEYNWHNIPRQISNQCLIKVSQGESLDNYDALNPTPNIEWQTTLGGSNAEQGKSIIESSDGNYVVAGWTGSRDGDVSGNNGDYRMWIVKQNSDNGNIIWQRNIGNTMQDVANSIIETKDGSYVVAGETYLTHGNLLSSDYNILKLNPYDGSTIWQKSFGGDTADGASSIIESKDGSYIVAGYSNSHIGDMTVNKGSYDYWVMKLSPADGSIIWQKNYGGSYADFASSLIESSDGSYIVVGTAGSNDGDVTGYKGQGDCWVLKLNPADGSIIWQKTYGGASREVANAIVESNDGNYVASGWTTSNNGDVTDYKGESDCWVLKISSMDGSIIWQKTLGGSGSDMSTAIIKNSDNSYLVAGYTNSNDGDVTGNHGDYDYWLVKLNPADGSIIWQKTYGGSELDQSYALMESSEGAYIMTGISKSTDGDIASNHGEYDFWTLKLFEPMILQSDMSDTLFSIVAPEISAIDIDMQSCLVGGIKDSLITNLITNSGKYKCRIDSVYFSGVDAEAFSIVSGFNKLELDTTESAALEIRFKPDSVREYNADIIIITQADTIHQMIHAVAIDSALLVMNNFIDFGVVNCGESKQYIDAATIKNIGKSEINITAIANSGSNDTDFQLLNYAPPYKLGVGDSLKISLKFTANSIGRTSGVLFLNYAGQTKPTEVQLYGRSVGGLVRIDDDSAYIGEKKKIKLRLMNNIIPVQSATVLPFRAKIKYSPTLLTITDSRGIKSVDGKYEICDIKGTWNTTNDNNLLAEFDYTAGLGKSISSYILLDDFFWLGSDGKDIKTEVEKIDGKFNLICTENPNDTLKVNSNIGIQSITPNPASDKFTVTAKITEVDTKIKLIDIAGNVIKEIDCAVDKNKTQEFTIDLTNIPAGMYFIEFKSPNFSQVEKVVVEK